jgi:hypothetical protein
MTDEEKKEFVKKTWIRVVLEGIRPNIEEINRAFAYKKIAVLVFEPHPISIPYLRSLGWDEKSPIFTLSNARAKEQAEDSEAQGDDVTVRWFRSGKAGRIYVCAHMGTYLLNYNHHKGFYIEPGSSTAEYEAKFN